MAANYPDYRPGKCAERKYPLDDKKLLIDGQPAKVAIIIPFLKEKKHHIIATAKSLLAQTPHSLLSEINFISDGNPPGETWAQDVAKLNPPDRPNLAHVTQNTERLCGD